jgi:hypothetical protein
MLCPFRAQEIGRVPASLLTDLLAILDVLSAAGATPAPLGPSARLDHPSNPLAILWTVCPYVESPEDSLALP